MKNLIEEMQKQITNLKKPSIAQNPMAGWLVNSPVRQDPQPMPDQEVMPESNDQPAAAANPDNTKQGEDTNSSNEGDESWATMSSVSTHTPHTNAVRNALHVEDDNDKSITTEQGPQVRDTEVNEDDAKLEKTASFSDVVAAPGEWQVQKAHQRRRQRQTRQQIQTHNQVNRNMTVTLTKADRKVQCSSPKDLKIIGQRREPAVTLYLEDIAREDSSDTDLATAVKQYAKSKGIRVMSAIIVSNKYCDDTVGCKNRIPETQEQKALCGYVWPDEIVCR
jgi:hypothetical protein